ncbi:MTH895/ArsE family thioredoxin-like protein [Thiomicrospira sp. S5]|uniref:MTH895/ArsE family thioredoxin-like protein n=1 Tax=Thiomicrospira sp. S5 TaxID=1803865 RepID=UPI000F8EFE6E|nr:MTH895/ArsE family thioredoxin-like protein [Thiomicrospira sp. S5]
MKGNLMVRMMTLMVLLAIALAHATGQTDLTRWNWLWLAVFAAGMGLQATFTGWCPSNLVGKLSKTGECCPSGSCDTSGSKASSKSAAALDETPCCGGDTGADESSVQTTACGATYDDNAKVVKVLGSGCANCETTARLIQAVAEEKGVAIELEKVEDIAEIAGYGVMSTPGVVIDEVVVHTGSVPDRQRIASWF